VWQVLNSMARHPGCLVVVNVRMINELGVDTKEAGRKFSSPHATPGASAPGAQAAAALAMATRDERIVSGQELVRVVLVLDTYQFTAPAAGKEGST
jgi:hypothetical protein